MSEEPESDTHDCERRIGDLCPGCLRKPCACPLDDSAVRAIFDSASAVVSADNREFKTFAAGWFAHARNSERLFVEDAWHVYRRPTPPTVTPDRPSAKEQP